MFGGEKAFEFDGERNRIERKEDVQVIDLAGCGAGCDGDPGTFVEESGGRFSKIVVGSEVVVEADFDRFVAGGDEVGVVIKNDLSEATRGAAEIDLIAVFARFGDE